MSTNTDQKWYVYAILPDASDVDDPASNALYIGKGCGQRKNEHKKEVLRSLSESRQGGSNPQKLAKIESLVASGKAVPSVRLGRHYVCEHDAYVAEQTLISLINRQRTSSGAPLLLNAVAGHGGDEAIDGDGLVSLDDYFAFTDSEDLVLPTTGGNRRGILVKAANEVPYFSPRIKPKPFLDSDGFPVPEIVHATIATPRNDRRAWDPHLPWNDQESRRRAARFWTFAVDDVIEWVRGANDRPTVCALAVDHKVKNAKNKDGKPIKKLKSTIRYAWMIDYQQPWQRFDGLWGIPLGTALNARETCLLGKALYDKIPAGDQPRRQALYARNKGCRTFRYTETGTLGAQW